MDNRTKFLEYIKRYQRVHYVKWNAEEIAKYEEMVPLCANGLLSLYKQKKRSSRVLTREMREELVKLCVERSQREVKVLEELEKKIVNLLRMVAMHSKRKKLWIWRNGECLGKKNFRYIVKR